ncbi:DNA ligase 3 isoform 2-T3 [Glossina fuscipes fuscipes]
MWKVEDNRLFVFANVCEKVAKESSYLNKAKILKDFFEHGSNHIGFNGDLLVWMRMLIPSDSQRVYNLQNKQMLKLFSRLFNIDPQIMQHDLEQNGDISEILSKYFTLSAKLVPQSISSLYLQEVDELLEELTKLTKEDEQTELLKQLCNQSTSADLKTVNSSELLKKENVYLDTYNFVVHQVICIIKQDLRMNAKANHVLAAFGPTAYPTYQVTRNLQSVVEQVRLTVPTTNRKTEAKLMSSKERKVKIMVPISPMLANACNSVEDAFKKCPNGLFSEIKYDGERVQIHRQGNDEFRFFSRNLKPVMEHKVKRFKEFIPQAFPCSGDMILDSEIILVDTVTNELLPFGTLGAHKKKKFQNAVVCLFVFDCMLFKGEDLTNLSFQDRRKILEDNIKPLKSYVQLSEIHFLKNKHELALMVAKVLKAHLEGVVLKDPCGTYQPGKRGWIKVKKDYLYQGKMADSADLVVLGASYGSGKKGGVLSIFLMGCYDSRDFLWKTVTKVHTGLDDNARLDMHDELLKLMERSNPYRVPTWLLCSKSLLPDFVAKDPLQMPVWEITGAEFTKSGENTTAGISIRFPRITRLRDDKTAKEATDLKHLEELYEASKNNVNVDLLLKHCDQPTNDIVINEKLSIPSSNIDNTSGEISERDCKEDSKDFLRPKCLKTKTGVKRQTAIDVFTKTSPKRSELNESNPEGCVDKNRKRKITSEEQKQSKVEVKEYKLDSDLFKDLVAYFSDELKSEDVIVNFKGNGGSVTFDTKVANVAFHETSTASIKLKDSRLKFHPFCRHLNIKWLEDSLERKSLQMYPFYAVFIR